MLFLDSLDRTLNKNTNVESKGKSEEEEKKITKIEMKCRESEENSLLHAHSSIRCVQI